MDTELDDASIRKSAQEALWKEMKWWIPAAIILGAIHAFLFRVVAGTGIGIVGGTLVAYLVLTVGWVSYGVRLIADLTKLEYNVLGKRIENLRTELGLTAQDGAPKTTTDISEKSLSSRIN